MRFDWIVVGAGLTGATIAERLAAQGKRVLVIDKRSHIAGNAHDASDEYGGLRHSYGPHIFHTNSETVWRYVNKFASWRPYFHRVLAAVDGREVPLPINLDSISELFPRHIAERYARRLTDRYRYGDRVPILRLMQEPDEELKALANYVYESVFLNYTVKQWALPPEALSPSVTARVPVVVSRDNRYFADRWQAMPVGGYTALVAKMLGHPAIKILLSTPYSDVRPLFPECHVAYTGPIDEYYDYCYGHLPYRSVRFEWDLIDGARKQSVGTINYPGNFDFTRITEMGHLTSLWGAKTTLVSEYPEAFEAGRNEPYYPIPTDQNQVLYRMYDERSRSEISVFFAGRLGAYKYLNMDQAIAAALKFASLHS